MDNQMPSEPPGWAEALKQARADVAAGRVVEGAVMHNELRASLARAAAQKPKASAD